MRDPDSTRQYACYVPRLKSLPESLLFLRFLLVFSPGQVAVMSAKVKNKMPRLPFIRMIFIYFVSIFCPVISFLFVCIKRTRTKRQKNKMPWNSHPRIFERSAKVINAAIHARTFSGWCHHTIISVCIINLSVYEVPFRTL